MESFCKREECPTSEVLLALSPRDPWMYTLELEEHLSRCEFCSAEVEFYRHYPPVEETVVVGEMPRPLFELAEALLKKDSDLSPLYRLIGSGA
jgi:hypothetical protein